MKSDTYRVPMRPHGLIFGGIEAYHLQDAFGSVPGPPGPQKRAKNDKKRQKLDFCRFSVPILLLKEASNSLEYSTVILAPGTCRR